MSSLVPASDGASPAGTRSALSGSRDLHESASLRLATLMFMPAQSEPGLEDETIRVLYEGPPARDGILEQELRQAGGTVRKNPGPERRGGHAGPATVVVLMVVGGIAKDVVEATAQAFMRKMQGKLGRKLRKEDLQILVDDVPLELDEDWD